MQSIITERYNKTLGWGSEQTSLGELTTLLLDARNRVHTLRARLTLSPSSHGPHPLLVGIEQILREPQGFVSTPYRLFFILTLCIPAPPGPPNYLLDQLRIDFYHKIVPIIIMGLNITHQKT